MSTYPGKKILIVSHTFPPAPGIGGRRWAKLAKYLQRAGVNVDVLTAQKEGLNSLWAGDVQGIPRAEWNHQYPAVLDTLPGNFREKALYRLALMQMKFITNGNPYDRAVKDRDAFQSMLEERLALKPDIAVVSAPPFNLLHYAAELIPAYPSVKWVADLRDPWTTGINYGYEALNPSRKMAEARKEKEALSAFHAVITPWPGLVDSLADRHPQFIDRIHWLPHCYDADEVKTREEAPEHPIPHLVYGGNLYPGFEPFFEKLDTLCEQGICTASIFSEKELRDSPAQIEWNTLLAPAQFFAKAAAADFLLFPIPESLRDGLPTKLYEYAATGVPLIATGYRGSLQELIEYQNLGTFIDLDAMPDKLRTLLSSRPYHAPDSHWCRQYECSHVARQFIDLLAPAP